ncbi:TIGR01777 family oxidoreductase [soil metagenome]
MEQKHALLAGGSGLIGTQLSKLLISRGWKVTGLSRTAGEKNGISYYAWNPAQRKIDPKAFEGVTHLVNLAGEGIADHRWTASFKEKILSSRLDASATLLQGINKIPNTITALIAASAIGIYGNRGDEIVDENTSPAHDFLGTTCVQWEQSYAASPVRTVLLRTGIVLSTDGGALVPMSQPLHFFITPILGNGKQYMSWIHMDDHCRIFAEAMENEQWQGIYNAVAPFPVPHRKFMMILREIISPKSICVPAPAFALNLVLGEQSAIVLEGSNVSAQKILQAGFKFKFPQLKEALNNLYGR